MNQLVTQVPVPTLRRIDAACDEFEDAWRSDRQPRIEDYLKYVEASERSQLLDALQKLQQELILSQIPSVNPVTAEMPVVDGPIEQAVPSPGRTLEARQPRLDGARVVLRVISGPHSGQEFSYSEHDTLFAGRLQRAQLRLENDLHFSRHHFRLEVNPPTCFLMDLSSRNGTFVNGERVKERFLQHGDVISGGRTKLEVSIYDARPIPRLSQPAASPSAGPVRIWQSPPPVPTLVSPISNEETSIHIAGYQVREQIGSGDMGVVYRAIRSSTGEECALKVIEPAANSDETAIQTFLREASILNQLKHPHIVRLIEMGASGSSVFLATEYVESISWPSLIKRCSSQQRINLACGLMSQLLGALDYAHTRSLVHRDVKPGNVLISKKEGKLTAKLADFGLAKQYTTAGMSQVTRDGDVIGSLPFMSPDQFLNSREARPTCDIYSAGATLYWLLTGHEPIPLDDHPCKFLAILESPPTPIQEFNPDIPPKVAQIVHRALEKTPDKRFASAAEMRQHLREFTRP